MSSDTLLELVGYLASGLVILSLSMRSIWRLRLVGLVGAIAFGVYGILIGSYPVAITNAIIVGLHSWHLRAMMRYEEYFTILEVRPDSLYLAYFCQFHSDEIRRFFPGWTHDPKPGERTLFVLRDMVPAGLWISRAHDDGSLEIVLDYVIPRYRDFKVGKFVYSADSPILDGTDRTRVWTEARTDDHATYLERMGFIKGERQGEEVYRLG
jgi:hypothetical protein